MTRSVKAPDLSVVVPSVNGWQDLRACLEAVEASGRQVSLEVLVADRCGDEVRRLIAQQFPEVRVLAAPEGTSIPDLRAIGFRAARAASVAVIEDHVIVPPNWARQMVDAQNSGEDVVGGSVYNAATDTTVDWAAFFCEYSHLLPPLPAGPTAWLTGNNTVYRRALLERYRTETQAGRWEDHLHATLRGAGVTLFCHPEIQVGHKKHYTFREYFTQRYLFARSYAGARVHATSWRTRVLYAAGAAALPPVLFFRIVGRVAGKKGYHTELAKSMPLIGLFVLGWAFGEMVGALKGAGDSLSRVS